MSIDTSNASPSPALPRERRSQGWLQGLLDPLGALVYLRYCMRRNAWRREQILGRIITALYWLGATIGVVGVCGLGVLLGYLVYFRSQTDSPVYFWNIVVVLFLIAWGIQLSTDLFRNDVLTLDRIMHLPISPSHAFMLNYLTSLINFPVVYLAGFASGAVIGASFARGPWALLLWIAVFGYLFMVTAVTYQFQGALAAWMSTPRRRQTVMILISVFFMIFFPAMSILLQWSDRYREASVPSEPTPVYLEPPGSRVSDAGPVPQDGMDGAGFPDPSAADAIAAGAREGSVPFSDPWPSRLRWLQVIVPPLWLAACGTALGDSSYHAWWITPCMIGLGLVAMRRSYRTTLRYYQDGFDVGPGKQKKRERDGDGASRGRLRWIERSLPGDRPLVSSIVMQTWISMWRAPEFKLMLLAPIIQPLLLAFLVQYWKIGQGEVARTLVLLGCGGLQLYTASGMLGNQFGLDRGGFRTWVLSPIPRAMILHGRNIAFGFPVWMLALAVTVVVGLWWSLAWDKILFVALAVTTFLPAYLLISDLMSILSPFGIPPGTLQPKEFSWKQVVISLAISTLHPTLLCCSALPLAGELLIQRLFPETHAWPIAVVLAVPWVGLSFLLYRMLLPGVGRLLERMELKILQTVTAPID